MPECLWNVHTFITGSDTETVVCGCCRVRIRKMLCTEARLEMATSLGPGQPTVWVALPG